MCICQFQSSNLSVLHLSPGNHEFLFYIGLYFCFVNKFICTIIFRFHMEAMSYDICLCLTSLVTVCRSSLLSWMSPVDGRFLGTFMTFRRLWDALESWTQSHFNHENVLSCIKASPRVCELRSLPSVGGSCAGVLGHLPAPSRTKGWDWRQAQVGRPVLIWLCALWAGREHVFAGGPLAPSAALGRWGCFQLFPAET